jgi:hypothetical protein
MAGEGADLAVVGYVYRKTVALLEERAYGEITPIEVDRTHDYAVGSINEAGGADTDAEHGSVRAFQQCVDQPVYALERGFPLRRVRGYIGWGDYLVTEIDHSPAESGAGKVQAEQVPGIVNDAQQDG